MTRHCWHSFCISVLASTTAMANRILQHLIERGAGAQAFVKVRW
jgi:hypothetical protein